LPSRTGVNSLSRQQQRTVRPSTQERT